MNYRPYSTDPYLAMLERSERKAIGYGLIVAMSSAIVLIIAHMTNDGAGQFAPVVAQVRYAVDIGLLCACGVSSSLSLSFIGRYAYFIKWPERFE